MKNKPSTRSGAPKAKRPKPKPKPATFKRDASIEEALRLFSVIKNQTAAARASGVSPKRLRKAIRELGFASRQGRSWEITDTTKRIMTVTTTEGRKRLQVVGRKTASLIGKHDNAVKAFIASNDPSHLDPYEGIVIRDASGVLHRLEARSNTIYGLAGSDEIFEFIYKWTL